MVSGGELLAGNHVTLICGGNQSAHETSSGGGGGDLLAPNLTLETSHGGSQSAREAWSAGAGEFRNHMTF